jgi:preprotein translocase subunit YajC
LHLLSPLWLQAATPSFGDNMAWVPLVGIVAVFYFLLIRPQQKQAQKQKALVAALRKGDQVVTQAGMFGKIYSVGDKDVVLEIGGNTKVRWLKSQIVGVEKSEDETAEAAQADKAGKKD